MNESFQFFVFDQTMIDECTELFIQTFSKEPWYDVFDSRQPVIDLFENHLANNYFLGYVLKKDNKIIALSLGFKKPWIQGMEYYIDHFCVAFEYQGQGIGSRLIEWIDEDLKKQGLNYIILNTKKGFPAERFYKKNGFKELDELILLAK